MKPAMPVAPGRRSRTSDSTSSQPAMTTKVRASAISRCRAAARQIACHSIVAPPRGCPNPGAGSDLGSATSLSAFPQDWQGRALRLRALTRWGSARRVKGRQRRKGAAPMFGLGYQELLLILVIVLILFGAQRLPDLARSLGSSVKEFKKGVADLKDEASPTEKKDGDKKA